MLDKEWFFIVWLTARYVFVVLVILFLINGLEDFLIDLIYLVRRGYRRLFRRHLVKPVTLEQLDSLREQAIAIMIPAWDESAVIAAMLLNTLRSLQYRNYHIFVGAYPNDEATISEVEKVRALYGNVVLALTKTDGPTSKADCLNSLYARVLEHEREYGEQFSVFVMHDAEDIVHPLSLKYFNYLMPRMDFIQLPVFPLEPKHNNLAAGVYMDEFAEHHLKDLRVRELMAGAIPCAGVGAGFSRRALDYLTEERGGEPFDVSSVAEDYLSGLTLARLSGKKILLQASHIMVRRNVDGRSETIKEQVATREYFPWRWGDSIRQKARWVLGISLQGWRLGWGKTFGENYWLYRDRKAVVSSLAVVLGYLLVGFWAFIAIYNRYYPEAKIPPLVEKGRWTYNATMVVFGFLSWRCICRIVAVKKIYGWGHAFFVLPRLIAGNIVNFAATVVALKRFFGALFKGVSPAWGKTRHMFPTTEQIEVFHRRLGDVLIERELVTVEDLDAAMEIQKQTGKKVGGILIDMGVLEDEDLVKALAHQQHRSSEEIDPYVVSEELIGLVPRELARKFRVFPLREENGVLVLATDLVGQAGKAHDLEAKQELEQELKRAVKLVWVASVDLEFAWERAYNHEVVSAPVGDRLGENLLQAGRITEDELQAALRKQKRTGALLGEILMREGIVTAEDIANGVTSPNA